jgi:hypothetical protein
MLTTTMLRTPRAWVLTGWSTRRSHARRRLQSL